MRAVIAMVLALAVAVPADASAFSVVQGQPAEEGRWPSVVALVRAEEPDDVAGQFCGGTAIAADLVLTAAHCFHDDAVTRWRQPDTVRIVAGRTDLAADGGVEVTGTQVFLHPEYEPQRRHHDLAVLRVDGDLGVPAQTLAESGAAGPFGGDRATVLGWGRTESNEAASSSTARLHQASVPIADEDVCRDAFEGLELATHLCAGGGGTLASPRPDACRGDSGGPLLVADPRDGTLRQVGITSFGPDACGIGDPGVYVRLSTARGFIDEVRAGRVAPSPLPDTTPEPTAPAPRVDPVRVAATGDGPTTPIAQAVAASKAVFQDGSAEVAVLARDDGFADALAGSALVYGAGPLLFTASSGPLDTATRDELRRVMAPGGTVYLLGGEAAVPGVVANQLNAMGLTPVRLAGATREATATAVAAEILAQHGDGSRPPFGTAIVVTSQTWPDAVVAGQLGVWWGYPVLLTPPDVLHPATRQSLSSMSVDTVVVIGGEGAVSDGVAEEIRELDGRIEVTRLAGDNRIATAVAVAEWHRAELERRGERAPDTVAAVNLRREDGYAHVLSATPLIGATAGVFLPVEGEAGDELTSGVRTAFCGVGGLPLVIGGTDLVSDEVQTTVADLLAGHGCG